MFLLACFLRVCAREWYKALRHARWGDMLPHLETEKGRFVLSQRPKKHKYSKPQKTSSTGTAAEGGSEENVTEGMFYDKGDDRSWPFEDDSS